MGLTGTPIQNSVLELWSLFQFLMPGCDIDGGGAGWLVAVVVVVVCLGGYLVSGSYGSCWCLLLLLLLVSLLVLVLLLGLLRLFDRRAACVCYPPLPPSRPMFVVASRPRPYLYNPGVCLGFSTLTLLYLFDPIHSYISPS